MKLPRPGWGKLARFLIGAFILYILLRIFVFDVYYIRSSSMRGTLWEGDYVLVNKFFLNEADRYDIIVFTPPAGDTTLQGTDHYIKRCVGMPGDTLEIRNGDLYVNGIQAIIPGLQYSWSVLTNGTEIPASLKRKMGLQENVKLPGNSAQSVYMTADAADSVRLLPSVLSVTRLLEEKGYCDEGMFAGKSGPCWNLDHFGPLIVPSKGWKLRLDPIGFHLYGQVIRLYEGRKISLENGKVLVDGKEASEYEFMYNYYFAMGDNRHFSMDSRIWGFLPEDHVNGTAGFIIWSSDPGTGERRGDRIFGFVD